MKANAKPNFSIRARRVAGIKAQIGYKRCPGIYDGVPIAIEGLLIANDAIAIKVGLDLQISKSTALAFIYADQVSIRPEEHGIKTDLMMMF